MQRGVGMRSREARVGETSIRDPRRGFAEVALQGLDFNNLLVQGVTLLEMLLKAEQDRATSKGREMAQAGVAEAKIGSKRWKIYSSHPFCGVILDSAWWDTTPVESACQTSKRSLCEGRKRAEVAICGNEAKKQANVSVSECSKA